MHRSASPRGDGGRRPVPRYRWRHVASKGDTRHSVSHCATIPFELQEEGPRPGGPAPRRPDDRRARPSRRRRPAAAGRSAAGASPERFRSGVRSGPPALGRRSGSNPHIPLDTANRFYCITCARRSSRPTGRPGARRRESAAAVYACRSRCVTRTRARDTRARAGDTRPGRGVTRASGRDTRPRGCVTRPGTCDTRPRGRVRRRGTCVMRQGRRDGVGDDRRSVAAPRRRAGDRRRGLGADGGRGPARTGGAGSTARRTRKPPTRVEDADRGRVR